MSAEKTRSWAAMWLAGGVVAGVAAAAATTAVVLSSPDGAPVAANPRSIFTRTDASDLFAQSSQGAVAMESAPLGDYPGEWTATGGAEIDYAFQAEGSGVARTEVTQGGYLHTSQLTNGSIAAYGVLPAGCRLELAHGDDHVSVSDSDVLGDADCWSVMRALAIKIDSRF